MFELENGLILALYPRTDLALDANQPDGIPSTTEFSIGHLVQSKEEVDTLLNQAKAAGATVTEEPYERPWGSIRGTLRIQTVIFGRLFGTRSLNLNRRFPHYVLELFFHDLQIEPGRISKSYQRNNPYGERYFSRRPKPDHHARRKASTD
jgi:hypothetical protein